MEDQEKYDDEKIDFYKLKKARNFLNQHCALSKNYSVWIEDEEKWVSSYKTKKN